MSKRHGAKRHFRMDYWRCHLEENEGTSAVLVIDQGHDGSTSPEQRRVRIKLRYYEAAELIGALRQMAEKAKENAKNVCNFLGVQP